jgi:hypothetical protein
MRIAKALLAVAGATLLLGALASAASARILSTSSQTLRASFREIRFNGAFGNSSCAVTVEGSFHQRTQAKVAGSLVGYITRADLGACAEGRATVLRETLPWHIQYSSFSGTLPNITAFRANVIGVSFRIQEPFAGCLGRSEAANPATVIFNREAGGALTTVTLGGSVPTSCGITGTFSSNAGPVTVLNSATRITLTLI